LSAYPALTPVRKVSAVDGVIDRLRELLRTGLPGAKLPGERELAKRLGVSRPTVREALGTLERMGVLDTRHGSGSTFAATGADVLKTPLAFLMALDRPSPADLHETRQLIEVHLAACAAERRTDADLRAMEAPLRELETRMAERRGYIDPDYRFHAALAASAHNPLLERIMTCLSENVVALMDSVVPDVHDWRASYVIHEKILGAIRRRNVPLARRLMTLHHTMMTDELKHARLIP
jgi:GntR family transcriptional regulator, transcriptional repressor for pyruvate dehydrogenase complex